MGEEFGLTSQFFNVCQGFADPLIASRELYANLKSRRQDAMMKHFKLISHYENQSHNAIEDANNTLVPDPTNRNHSTNSAKPICGWTVLHNFLSFTILNNDPFSYTSRLAAVDSFVVGFFNGFKYLSKLSVKLAVMAPIWRISGSGVNNPVVARSKNTKLASG